MTPTTPSLGNDSAAKPVPVPDPISAFYWEGARRHQLMLQRCLTCEFFLHPPDPACVRCGSESFEHVAVTGQGTIYAFTVARQAFHKCFVPEVPYVLALVELEEQSGLRLLTNIVGAEVSALASGVPVEVVFEERGEWSLPQFRPVPPTTS
jgi:uncharacterized OB-fold protein